MRIRSNLLVICSVLGLGPACVIQGAEPTASMTIHVDQPGISVSPLLYGIFFEEINRAGDGGLYAEMVQNRAFEDDPGKPVAWSLVRRGEAVGNITLDKAQPLNNHTPASLRLEVVDPKSGCVGAASEGFQGIAVQQGGQYRLSFYARCSNGSRGLATASLETPGGEVLAVQEVTGITPEWQQFRCTLKAVKADSSARLVIGSSATGVLWLDVVSLFPQQTYQGHACRTDLAQMLKDMKPAFVRFPGGCYVEGDELANAFRWKDTIGDVAKRPGHWNLWGYRSNDGLGYLEYLQLCQDLGTEPLFVINCGMAHKDVVPLERMQEFVQDALDAIEYANGDAGSTKWGKLRAEHGHPPVRLEVHRDRQRERRPGV